MTVLPSYSLSIHSIVVERTILRSVIVHQIPALQSQGVGLLCTFQSLLSHLCWGKFSKMCWHIVCVHISPHETKQSLVGLQIYAVKKNAVMHTQPVFFFTFGLRGAVQYNHIYTGGHSEAPLDRGLLLYSRTLKQKLLRKATFAIFFFLTEIKYSQCLTK